MSNRDFRINHLLWKRNAFVENVRNSGITNAEEYVDMWLDALKKNHHKLSEKVFPIEDEIYDEKVFLHPGCLTLSFNVSQLLRSPNKTCIAISKQDFLRGHIAYAKDTKIRYAYQKRTPPILIVPYPLENSYNLVVDGNHRTCAFMQSGFSSINAYVMTDFFEIVDSLSSTFEQAFYTMIFEFSKIYNIAKQGKTTIHCEESAAAYFLES